MTEGDLQSLRFELEWLVTAGVKMIRLFGLMAYQPLMDI